MILPTFLAPMADRSRDEAHETPAGPWDPPEQFPGELALRDLAACRDHAAATERVVARYVVLRAVQLQHTAATAAAAAAAANERAWARPYLEDVSDVAERRALDDILEHTASSPSPVLWGALETAADTAADSGHHAGACAFRRLAYALQTDVGAWVDAARTARALEAAARAVGDARRARLWAARARRLVRRRIAPQLIMETMTESYSKDERDELTRMARAREPLRCPACGEVVVERKVAPRDDVAYVRRRVLLLCTGCRRSAAIDVSADGQP